MNLFKKLFIPSGEQKELTAYQKWSVRWDSRHGAFYADTRPELEIFTNEEEANAFANALKSAYKLLKHTSGTNVTVKFEG